MRLSYPERFYGINVLILNLFIYDLIRHILIEALVVSSYKTMQKERELGEEAGGQFSKTNEDDGES